MKIEKVYTSIDTDYSVSEFYNCRFEGCTFSPDNHIGNEFHDCVFYNCDCSLMAVDDCIFDNVIFEECRLSGINFGKINHFLFAVSFIYSILDYTVFEKNNLKDTSFTRCSIKEACFIDSTLRSAKFDECDLYKTLFDRSNIEKADFTSSKNYFIDLDKNKIKGARFSLPEAANLLLKYDIEIL